MGRLGLGSNKKVGVPLAPLEIFDLKGKIFGLNVQNLIEGPKRLNKTTFPLILRPLA